MKHWKACALALGFILLVGAAKTIPNALWFQSLATGGVLRKQSDKLGDIVSVKDFGSDGPALSAAIAALPTNGGTVILSEDITISSSLTLTMTANRPIQIDLQGHRITLSHTSGVGLTVDGGGPAAGTRQPFAIRNGTIYGNATGSITGVKLINMFHGAVREVSFTGFTGTSQTALLLDFVEDTTFDTVTFYNNSGSGTICLDLTNFSNANKYSAVLFQENKQAVRIRGGTSDNWFSDCLVQSNTATNAITVEVTGTDGNITGTHFERCHFENNGDATANASAIYFNTDAGKVITNTSLIGNFIAGTTNGGTGVALRFSATGTPLGSITSVANYYNTFATVLGGTVPNGASFVSVNDKDDTATLTASVQLATGGTNGITFGPQGGTKKFRLSAGYTGAQDSTLIFRDASASVDILTYNSSTWSFVKSLQLSASAFAFAKATPTYAAPTPINFANGNWQIITATNNTAFTISNPTNVLTGGRLIVTLKNTSGGALGAVTWDTLYKLGAAWASPATGFNRTIEFQYDGTNWIELNRSAVDVTN